MPFPLTDVFELLPVNSTKRSTYIRGVFGKTGEQVLPRENVNGYQEKSSSRYIRTRKVASMILHIILAFMTLYRYSHSANTKTQLHKQTGLNHSNVPNILAP